MIRTQIVEELNNFINCFGATANGSEWYLFGSVDRDEFLASDIDLLILCISDDQADALRRDFDLDCFFLPVHLSLMTFREAAEVNAVHLQMASRIFPPLEANIIKVK